MESSMMPLQATQADNLPSSLNLNSIPILTGKDKFDYWMIYV